MKENSDLASLLSAHMEESGFGDARLARTVQQRVGKPEFIHRSTIRNWRTGTSKKVENWRQLAVVATVLHLSELKANQLFQAAGLPPIHQLRIAANDADQNYLSYWTERDPVQRIDENLHRIQAEVSDISDTLNHNQNESDSNRTGLPTEPLSVHTWRYKADGGIASISVSADGSRVVAGSLSKQLIILDGNGGYLQKTRLGNQIWRLGMSADGDVVAAGTGSVRFWDMAGRGISCLSGDGRIQWTKDLEASVWGLSCSRDGSTIAVGTSARQLLVLDNKGRLLWRHEIPGMGWFSWIWATALSADGQVIVAGAADNHIRLFDRSGKIAAEQATRGDVFTVSVSANGDVVAAADKKGNVYVLDNQGNLLWKQSVDEYIWKIKLSDDGNQLLVGAGKKNHHIHLYDRGGSLLWRRFVGGNASCLDLSAEGRLISVGTYEGEIRIFDGTGNVLSKTQADKKIRDIVVSIDGTTVAAGSEDGLVYGFKLLTG